MAIQLPCNVFYIDRLLARVPVLGHCSVTGILFKGTNSPLWRLALHYEAYINRDMRGIHSLRDD